jgi:glycosyltransferase involved in cell wall biosynthesis
MHILFLSDNFPPEVNAPASRTFEHCQEWVKAGHRVTVITCAPNFPKGRVYPGYRNRLWQSEVMEGVRVIRVWSYITANEGFSKRVLDYLSYMWMASFAAPFVRGVDLVVGTSPQFFTACAACLVSRYKRIPFIFELRDLWPESIKAVGAMQDSVTVRFLERLELFLYRKAARIVTVTHAFRRNLASRGVDPEKIVVVTNGVDVSRFQPRRKDAELVARYGLEGKFVAGYIGTHGMAHALETLLEAAARLRDSTDGERFRLLFLGDGASKPSLMAKARAMGLHNVMFLDSVPKDDVPRYWSLLDTSIVHLKKSALFSTVIPSKLFECMGMGIPLLHVFEPENAAELCNGLQRLAQDRGLYERLRGSALKAARRYDRTALAREMLDVLEGVTSQRPESVAITGDQAR